MTSRQLLRRDFLKLLGAGAATATASEAPLMLAVPINAADQTDHDRRMGWWRDARFGMFFHWGLYSILAGEWEGKKTPRIGEWIMHDLQIPIAAYEQLVGQFNPIRYDAREWVRMAKQAGMKYVVITSKHHEGFCLWDSRLTDYDVTATPYKRDLLGPLAEACQEVGIRLCFYHSIMDWHHPDYLPRRNWDTRAAKDASFDRYVEYMKGQLGELVKNYDPGVLWFDGEREETWTHERGVDLYSYVRKLRPGIIINNRVDKGRDGMRGMTKPGFFKGDFDTPEQEIPATGVPGVDWESCMTMNDTWGYRRDDHNWKSSQVLIRSLIDIASKGGNFLLNVGPTVEGLIPRPSVERLAEMGRWMKINGEAIYGTTASPFEKLPWGRCTQAPGKLYLHVFEWPQGRRLLVPISNEVKKVRLLSDPSKSLSAKATDQGIVVHLPHSVPDPRASVIAVEIEGAPRLLNL